LPHRFGTISFSVAAPRADVHMCVVPHPRPEGGRNRREKRETSRPFAVLPWADEDEAAGIRNHTSEEARRRLFLDRTKSPRHRTNPESKSIQRARAWHWHRARPIHGPLLVRPNCHFKRAPDSPRAVSDSRAACESDRASEGPTGAILRRTPILFLCLQCPTLLATLLAGSGCLPAWPPFVLHRSAMG